MITNEITSPKAKLLIAIQEKMKADVPEVRQTIRDVGQLEFYAQGGKPMVSFPALLIAFDAVPYKEMQMRQQWGTPNIRMRLAWDTMSDTSSLAPEQVQIIGLQYYEVENKIFKAFQDWNAGGLLIEPMIRLNESAEIRDDPFTVVIMNYKATFADTY